MDIPVDNFLKTFSDACRLNPKLIQGVGYLRRGEAFDTGDMDEQVFERLCDLTQNPWQPWACGGVHHCDLCRFTGNSVSTYYKKSPSGNIQARYPVSATSSTVDLWIPSDGFLWTCPTSVTHYIDAHGFCPPPKFCEAALRCPPIQSMDYTKAILANGGHELGFGSRHFSPE